jgi:hypothetical protein
MTEDDGSASGDHVVMRRGDERYFCNHVIRLDEKVVRGHMVSKGGREMFQCPVSVGTGEF